MADPAVEREAVERTVRVGRRAAALASWVALGVGTVCGLVVFAAARQVLVNNLGPFAGDTTRAVLACIAAGVVTGAVGALTTWAVVRVSWWGLLPLAAGLVVVAVVGFPTRTAMKTWSEEQPRVSAVCSGFTFEYYPPGAGDADTETWCIGLERPAPTG